MRAIVSLAHSLELDVTAEGVENKVQHEFVRKLGCETFQGFLCSEPMPADQFLVALKAATDTTASRPQRLGCSRWAEVFSRRLAPKATCLSGLFFHCRDAAGCHRTRPARKSPTTSATRRR